MNDTPALNKHNFNDFPRMYFYYKGDTDEGISLCIVDKPFRDGVTSFDLYKGMRDALIKDLEENDDIDTDWYVCQTEQYIKQYWLSRTGSTIQPSNGYIDTYENFTKEEFTTHTVICGNIWALTDLGVIKSDNHNGYVTMKVNPSSDEILKELEVDE